MRTDRAGVVYTRIRAETAWRYADLLPVLTVAVEVRGDFRIDWRDRRPSMVPHRQKVAVPPVVDPETLDMTRTNFLPLLLAAALVAPSCQSSASSDAPRDAQQVVERIASEHPNVVRLTVHATPAGQSQLRAVASTSDAKRGQPSDPEDVRALETGQQVVLQEGDDLDVTLPMGSGQQRWVAGVTLRGAGRSRDQLIADARAIAGEIDAAIAAAKQPLW